MSIRLQAETAPATPVAGYANLYWDTTLRRLGALDEYGQKVMLPGILATTSASAASTNATETKSMIGTVVGSFTIGASHLLVGKMFRLSAWGFITTSGTPGTINWIAKIGSVTIASTGALTPTINMASRPWHMECVFTVRAVGSGTSANVFAQGNFSYDAVTPSSATTSAISWQMVNSAVSSGFDSTATQLVDFVTTTSSNVNTITCSNASLEMLN